MKAKKVPKMLQSALWSYNLDKLDINNPKDQRIIVEQVFNYGISDQVGWVLSNLPLKEIKEVVKKPSRGVWHKDSLDYWQTVLELKLSDEIYQRAILNIHPHNETFFKHS